jgi:hypothetical protein
MSCHQHQFSSERVATQPAVLTHDDDCPIEATQVGNMKSFWVAHTPIAHNNTTYTHTHTHDWIDYVNITEVDEGLLVSLLEQEHSSYKQRIQQKAELMGYQ